MESNLWCCCHTHLYSGIFAKMMFQLLFESGLCSVEGMDSNNLFTTWKHGIWSWPYTRILFSACPSVPSVLNFLYELAKTSLTKSFLKARPLKWSNLSANLLVWCCGSGLSWATAATFRVPDSVFVSVSDCSWWTRFHSFTWIWLKSKDTQENIPMEFYEVTES